MKWLASVTFVGITRGFHVVGLDVASLDVAGLGVVSLDVALAHTLSLGRMKWLFSITFVASPRAGVRSLVEEIVPTLLIRAPRNNQHITYLKEPLYESRRCLDLLWCTEARDAVLNLLVRVSSQPAEHINQLCSQCMMGVWMFPKCDECQRDGCVGTSNEASQAHLFSMLLKSSGSREPNDYPSRRARGHGKTVPDMGHGAGHGAVIAVWYSDGRVECDKV
ncbi:hypothetical protein F4680DRAFT_340325 [Xylaria scruposa]|nr:hypothetical protein F4680DRAFT_340325 [Xylaria scruposa]